ncbi:MAG: DivIVA domain-containing protein [Candidatus Faecousia sp.]|nr:DivIVA domain-containing protein [Clostridiales bacterium]MCI6938057.1 DivIVA domain-containing protein [Clostridiales bacterium]MDD5883730.1 DivIVA domain-containing protein [Bacillota bacterium]MDY4599168.1 DivIVA domain-containing protein [Candidatus Faecousia sp.]
MLTPQQIDQVSFGRSTFGGYDMQQVDEFLEPLTEDYVTLYKENALLKSKMRVLVGKLEEYRKNEASMKDAVINAQKTCDKMVAEAEAKCAKMLSNASAAAAAPVAAPAASSVNSDAMVAAENARVQEARKAAAAKIGELQDQLRTCIQALERIKDANAPVPAPAPKAAPAPVESADVADEIAQNIEAMIGSTVDTAPKAAPKHPTNNDTTTSKFASLNLQFGRNYDPTSK